MIDGHEAFGLANHAFHESLVSLAGNQTLRMLAGTLDNVLASALIAVSRADKHLTSSATRHRDLRSQVRLVDLIEAGDADGAEKHWRAHLEYLSRTMTRAAATTFVALLP